MQELHTLIQSLSKPQIKILRSYLTYMSIRKDESSKQFELANLLYEKKKACPTEEKCSEIVLGEVNLNNINQVKRRLRSKVLDVLTTDMNILRKGDLDAADFVSIKVRKKLLQFQVLYRTKGNLNYNKRLLDDIISEAKEYEIYEPLISALNYRKYFKGFCKGLSDFKEINKQIGFYEYAKTALVSANDYYYQLIMWDNFSKSSKQDKMQSFLGKCIMEIKKDHKHTGSANILYYLKLMEMAYFENSEEYVSARETAFEILDILKKNKAIFRKQRVSTAYGNLSLFNLYLKDYHQSLLNARSQTQYVPEQSANYAIAKEQEFKVALYGDYLKDAEAAAKELLKSSRFSQGDFRLAKYRFYHANVLFKKQEYKKALQALNEKFEISKDKAGWYIAIQVLSIMSNIELGRMDKAATEIKTLRKHIERMGKTKDDLSLRNKMIIRMLSTFKRNGFVKEGLLPSLYNTLDLIASDEKKYRWEPLTPELIPFHTWMADKLRYKLPVPKIAVPVKKQKRELVLK